MNKGFTLIELLVVMAVSGIIMTGVYSAFKTQQDSYIAQDQVAEMQQNLRAGLSILADDLRMAGYDIDKNGTKTGTAGVTTAKANEITFTLVADTDGIDNDNADGDNKSATGADETGELKTITYQLYDAYTDGDMDLGRKVDGSVNQAVAENIEQLEFYYTLDDGTQTLTPTAAQLSKIRSVEVSILATTNHLDRNYTNIQTYTSASGVDWTPATKDNFRRRFQSMTVQCRNMGM